MEKYLSHNGNLIQRGAYKFVYRNYTPGTVLPPYTLRLKFKEGVTPTFSYGTGTLFDATNNIWDLTYENNDWSNLLYSQSDLLEVIDGNTTNVVYMNRMFRGCTSLSSVTLFDTSSVTSMNYMFHTCTLLASVPLFDTSNVTDMSKMFFDCDSLTTVPLFDTSSVTDMNAMFARCSVLITVPLFNTSNVTDMSSMFTSCPLLTTVPLFDTSNVTDMNGMFYPCVSLTNIPLFNTTKVTDMRNMFYDCVNVQSGALALYQQASSRVTPPSHSYTFRFCGSNTETGAAELAQIPTSWGGTMKE